MKSRMLAYAFVCALLGVPLQMTAQQQKVSLSLNRVSLKRVLSEIEKKTQYKFSYRDVTLDNSKLVSVQKNDVTVASVLSELLGERDLEYKLVEPSTIIISVKTNTEKKDKKKLRSSGMVLDAHGEPVIGATVQVVGKKNSGTITDLTGKFSLDVNDGDQLEISYVGFQTLRVRPKENMNIKMEENQESLNEVVVVG